MKKWLVSFVLIVALLVCTSALADYDFSWGYVDADGNVVIPYNAKGAAVAFSEGLAAVFDGEIDRSGMGGEGKYGYIDTTGTMVLPPQWDFAASFQEGLAPVFSGTMNMYGGTPDIGKWGAINKQGVLVIPCQWDFIYYFSEGFVMVGENSPSQDGAPDKQRYGFMDAMGNMVSPCQWDAAESFQEGLAVVAKDEPSQDGSAAKRKYGFIDTKGNVVVPLTWDSATSFSDGLAMVKLDGKCGYIDASGAIIIEPMWDATYGFGSGRAAVFTGTIDSYGNAIQGKWGMVDLKGNLKHPLIYDKISSFSTETMQVKNDGLIMQLDINTGAALITYAYDHVYAYDGNAHYASQNVLGPDGLPDYNLTQYYLINEAGEPLNSTPFDHVTTSDLFEGYIVLKDNMYGLFDADGKQLTPIKYKELIFLSQNRVRFSENSLYGIMDIHGTVIAQPQWLVLEPITDGLSLVFHNNDSNALGISHSPPWLEASASTIILLLISHLASQGL